MRHSGCVKLLALLSGCGVVALVGACGAQDPEHIPELVTVSLLSMLLGLALGNRP